MNNVSVQSKDGSKAIVTAQHYAQEMQAIRKSPALPAMSEFDLQRADEMSKTLIRSEEHLDDIVVFGSEAQATLAKYHKRYAARRAGRLIGRSDPAIRRRAGADPYPRYQRPFPSGT